MGGAGAAAAPLYEVFSSIQGEATRIGERHLFVRLAGCDLECVFCDTPASHRIPDHARAFFPGGAEEVANPIARDDLDELVVRLDDAAGPHHAVSVTGGEPLLFTDYLKPLLARWRERGWPVLLETGGHRPDELAEVIDDVAVVMADIKIASSAGLKTDEERTAMFLRLASRRECAVKVVVNAATTDAECIAVAGLVAAHAPSAPLILQPVSGAKFGPPSGDHLLALQRAAMRVHADTRVIPQAHRILHVR